MAKERVINTYTENKFLNVPSNSLFNYGSFNITSNFDDKITKVYDNKLIAFSTPITLETIGLDNTESDIFNIKTTKLILNLDRTDLNTFVRFGSAYEFLRISLENIILNYPGSLYFNSQYNSLSTVLSYTYDPYNNISTLYLAGDKIVNKFELIYDSSNLTYEVGREIKNINNSFTKYNLWLPISADTSFNILEFTGKTSTENWIIIKVTGEVFPNGLVSTLDLHIKPNNDVFEQYLILLSDYERYILSQRNNNTEFSYVLKSPTLQDNGTIIYVNTNLNWNTKDGYNIDVDTIQYQKMLEIVLTIGEKYDTVKTDLIARFLSPSSIKLYDTTEQGKVTKLLRIYGYEFDKLREFIDSMVNINKLSYNKINNIPDQLISNLSKVLGWNYTSIVNDEEFISNIFTVDNNINNQNSLTPSEIDIELWRRILINTNYFWKSKGTRESIKAILLIMGIPEQFININEYVYTVDGKINPNESNLVPVDFPSNSLPYDTLGYPKAPLETNDFYFQIGGDSDSGQEYMDAFRTAGFKLNLTIDNKKSWIQEGEIDRSNSITPTYHQEDSRLVLNTKEIDLSLDAMQGIDYDIYQYYINNPNLFSDYYGVGTITGMTFLEFITIVQKRLINAKNRKIVSDFKGGWYPALYKIYSTYLNNPSGYTYEIVYSFITKYSEIFETFVNQVIPITVIRRNNGIVIRNSTFNKQKFMYRRGTYMGVVDTYGGLTGETTFNYDSNLQYLGDDGANDIRLQYQYSSIFSSSFSICQIGTLITTTTTTTVPSTTTTTTTTIPVTTTTTTDSPTTTTTTTVPVTTTTTTTVASTTTTTTTVPITTTTTTTIDPLIDEYGYLYNWYAVTNVNYITAADWSVPTLDQAVTLRTFLGGPTEDSAKMRVSGTTNWIAPNSGATNTSGFNAKGAGDRTAGVFQNYQYQLTFWVYYTDLSPYTKYVVVDNTTGFNNPTENTGNSIRLIRNSTILSDGETGTYTGNDGKVYQTICIGTQEWLASNLKETEYRDHSPIPELQSSSPWLADTTGARCYYVI